MITLYCPQCYAANPDTAKRCHACGAPLNTDDDQDFVDGLIWALRHPEPTVAPRAAWILGNLREPRAVAPLLELLERSEDMGSLAEAATALGKIGDAAAVPALERLLRGSYLPVRLRAVDALARIGGAKAVRVLREAAEDPSAAVRWAAREALEVAGPSEEVG